MSFTSPEFFLFIALILPAYVIFKPRWRWAVLLAGSLVFYAALGAPYLLAALAAVTLASFFGGLWMGRVDAERRKPYLWAGIFLNLAVLLVFRYLGDLAHFFDPASGALPVFISVGVSFYAFQGISYLADIYKKRIEPEPHLGHFALYMAFFPKILQGPIERGANLLPQLKGDLTFSEPAAAAGLRRFGWGVFKKLVVADRLGLLVNPVFANVHDYTGLSLLLAVYLFAFQLYFDFSGYTDMALGLAGLFNIRLSENFDRPYLARTVTDFWRRWHMSFSHWIRDYIFMPLQSAWRRWGGWRVVAALLVTFLASGLWHGIAWTFVAWGLLFGIFMCLEWLYTPYRRRLYAWLHIEKSRLAGAWQVFVTFNLVCFAWIFFRASTISDALYIAGNLFNGVNVLACGKLAVKYGLYLPVFKGIVNPAAFSSAASQVCTNTLANFPAFSSQFLGQNMAVLLVSAVILALGGWIGKRLPAGRWPAGVRWAGYALFSFWVLYGLAILEAPGQAYTQFLYFKF